VPDTLTVLKEIEEIRLQPREFALLEFLARHPNQVFSGDALLRRIWPSESETTTDAVRTTVKKIRQKLDEKIIDTASGGGYKLGS
jgi:DNA-binding response OmpR family regulator